MIKRENPALLAGLSSGEKFLFSGITLLIIGIGFQLLGAAIASWIYGFSFGEMMNLDTYDDPANIAALKLMQIISSIGTFIIPALLFSFFFAGGAFSFYSFSKVHGAVSVILIILMMLAVIPFINYLAEWNLKLHFNIDWIDRNLRELETSAENIMDAFMSTKTLAGLFTNLLMIGIIASIGEELIFRGLIQRILTGWTRNSHAAIIITAFIFSLFHFQFLSFLPRLVLGIILGYLMYFGRSIWYPILAHFINNSLGVIYYFFYSRGSTDDVWEEIGTSNFFPVSALLSLLLFLLFFLGWYYRVRMINRSVPPWQTGID